MKQADKARIQQTQEPFVAHFILMDLDLLKNFVLAAERVQSSEKRMGIRGYFFLFEYDKLWADSQLCWKLQLSWNVSGFLRNKFLSIKQGLVGY